MIFVTYVRAFAMLTLGPSVVRAQSGPPASRPWQCLIGQHTASEKDETKRRPFCLAVGNHLPTFQAKTVLKYLDKTSVFRQNIITSTIVIWVSLLTGPLCVIPLFPSTLQVRFPNRDARDMQHDNPRSAQLPRSVR